MTKHQKYSLTTKIGRNDEIMHNYEGKQNMNLNPESPIWIRFGPSTQADRLQKYHEKEIKESVGKIRSITTKIEEEI